MLPLVIQREAEADLREAYLWYEGQRRGLGDEFLSAIEATLAAVSRRPESFAIAATPIRRALARRFPYGVFFVIENDSIQVLAVFHASRDPGKWQSRRKQKE